MWCSSCLPLTLRTTRVYFEEQRAGRFIRVCRSWSVWTESNDRSMIIHCIPFFETMIMLLQLYTTKNFALIESESKFKD